MILLMMSGIREENFSRTFVNSQRIMMIQVNPGSMVRLSRGGGGNSLSSFNRRGGGGGRRGGGGQQMRIRMIQPTMLQF